MRRKKLIYWRKSVRGVSGTPSHPGNPGFGFTLRGLGLAPVILIVVLVSAWASRYASLPSSALLAVGIAAFCTLLFIRGLGLPLPVLGPWLSLGYWSAPAPAPAEPAPAEPAPAQ
jgi:hypothetical protein